MGGKWQGVAQSIAAIFEHWKYAIHPDPGIRAGIIARIISLAINYCVVIGEAEVQVCKYRAMRWVLKGNGTFTFSASSYVCLPSCEVLFPSHSCTFILMTRLLFYSSFQQLINELHTSDMTPPCPIISSIYFYGTKHCRFVGCLVRKLAQEAVTLIAKTMQQ